MSDPAKTFSRAEALHSPCPGCGHQVRFHSEVSGCLHTTDGRISLQGDCDCERAESELLRAVRDAT